MPTTTPQQAKQLSYDGFGIGGDDEYKSRLLNWAKDSRGEYILTEPTRNLLGKALVHRYNTHAALVAALELAQVTIERLEVKQGPFSSVQGTLDVINKALAQERSHP